MTKPFDKDHDLRIANPDSNTGSEGWARQGVLMLNTVLTVEVGSAGAHMNCGWQSLTSDIVRMLTGRASPPTFPTIRR